VQRDLEYIRTLRQAEATAEEEHKLVGDSEKLFRVGQNHIYIYIYIYGLCTVFLAGKSPNRYTVMYGVYVRFWPTLQMFGAI